MDAALWYAFLAKHMMPVGHTNDVPKKRTVVVYALMTEMPINVGKLIFFQINLIINNSNLALYFSTIITELCARARVVFHDDDEWLQPMKPIYDLQWKAKFDKRQVDFSDDVVFGIGESSSQPLPQAPAQTPLQPRYQPSEIG